MKVLFSLLIPLIAVFLIVSGCSRDEQPPVSNEGVKIVKRIVKPPPRDQEEKPIAPQEKTVERPPELVQNTAPEEETPQTPQIPQPVKNDITEEKISQTPPPEPPPPPEPSPEDPGHYISKTGETLMGIAGKQEVYGDPLKWPILCRYAVDTRGSFEMKGEFHRAVLPEGIRFRILQPEEFRENLKMRKDCRWVVSVLSSTIEEKILPPIVTLLKEGYPVYLTDTRIKGNDWMRVRVGFFRSRAEAEAEGKKIMTLLKFDDLWVTKIGEQEFEEFAGY